MEHSTLLRKRWRIFFKIALLTLIIFSGGFPILVHFQHRELNRIAFQERAYIVSEWTGPDSDLLKQLCGRLELEAFYSATEIYVGSAPEDARTHECIPPNSNPYIPSNNKFDNASLRSLIEKIPDPGKVRRVCISNCDVTPDGLNALLLLRNLNSVVWIEPSASEAELLRVAGRLPFRVISVRPETCRPYVPVR